MARVGVQHGIGETAVHRVKLEPEDRNGGGAWRECAVERNPVDSVGG